MGLLPDTQNWGLRMRREFRERFSCHRLQKKTLVSDIGMHHGTCITHVPWCMSGSLTRGGGENVPGIPGACANRNCVYLVRGPCLDDGIFILCHIPDCVSPGFQLGSAPLLNDVHGGVVLVTIGLSSGFWYVRWCVTLWILFCLSGHTVWYNHINQWHGYVVWCLFAVSALSYGLNHCWLIVHRVLGKNGS